MTCKAVSGSSRATDFGFIENSFVIYFIRESFVHYLLISFFITVIIAKVISLGFIGLNSAIAMVNSHFGGCKELLRNKFSGFRLRIVINQSLSQKKVKSYFFTIPKYMIAAVLMVLETILIAKKIIKHKQVESRYREMRQIHSKMDSEFIEMENIISVLYQTIYDSYVDVASDCNSIKVVQQQLLDKDKERYYYS